MTALLAVEWMKLKRYKTFWVLVVLFLILLPLWNYEIAKGELNFGGGGPNQSVNLLSTAYTFPDVWGNVGFWGSIFIVFMSILVVIITTNEFTYRTHRQNMIDGWERLQFFNAKVLVVFCLSLFATIYVFLTGLFIGVVNGGSIQNAFAEIHNILYFFLLALDYLGLAFFLAILVRRSGLAIGLFLLYNNVVEHILKSYLNSQSSIPLGNFLPLQASDEMLPFQFSKMVKGMFQSADISTSTYAIATVCWCAIYYFAGRTILMRKDW
jgi:ABC-2 type transport system permease protein